MESDDKAYCSNQEALQNGRLGLPSKAEAGIAELGL
jgi:hypothetical protein